MASAAPSLPTRIVLRNVGLLALCHGLQVGIISLNLTASKLLGESYASSNLVYTLVQAVLLVGMFLFAFPSARVIARVGRQRGFQLGAMLIFTGSLLCVLAMLQHSWYGILGSTLLVGGGLSFGNYFIFAANDGAPAYYSGRISGFILLGGVLAAIIGPNAAKIASEGKQYFPDWPIFDTPMLGVPLITLLFSTLMFLLVSLTHLPKASKAPAAANSAELIQVMMHKNFWLVALVGASSYGAMTLAMNATTPWMFDHGMHIHHSASVISAHLLGMFIPAPFCGWWADRIGAIKVALVGFFVITLSLLMLWWDQAEITFYVALILLGVGWSMSAVAGTKLVIAYGRHHAQHRNAVEAGSVILIALANIFSAGNAAVIYYTLHGTGVVALSFVFVLIGTIAVLGWRKQLKAV